MVLSILVMTLGVVWLGPLTMVKKILFPPLVWCLSRLSARLADCRKFLTVVVGVLASGFPCLLCMGWDRVASFLIVSVRWCGADRVPVE